MNINLNPFPTLETGRLTLRRLELKDSQQIFQLRADDRVNAYLDRNKAVTIQDAENFISNIERTLQNEQGLYWAIAIKPDDLLIGTICYFGLDQENNMAEIGYELNPEYHGQGFMQEAIEKVIAYGFDVMQLDTIIASPRIDNESSVKILKRNGFESDSNPAENLNDTAESRYAMYVLKK